MQTTAMRISLLLIWTNDQVSDAVYAVLAHYLQTAACVDMSGAASV